MLVNDKRDLRYVKYAKKRIRKMEERCLSTISEVRVIGRREKGASLSNGSKYEKTNKRY